MTVSADRGPATITDVHGGVTGVEATYDAVHALADDFDAAGDRLRGWAALGARIVADPDLIESALLSPVTFAEAEHSVLAATTGTHGLLVDSAGWECDALLVRATVAAFEQTDRLVHDAIESIDRAVGRTVELSLGITSPAWLPALALTVRSMPRSERDHLVRALGDWAVDHPDVVQHTINGSGGLLDTESAAGLIAGVYGDDGTPEVRPIAVRSETSQPRDLTELIGHLREVADLSPHADSRLNGTIEVQTIGHGADVRHIVYLPGTDDLTTLPWTQDRDVRDMATNLLLIGGRDNAYQQGILDAMARAHIGPDDPVLLVGHSQGGMEAAAILSRGSDFNVTDVVTAGAPTAQVDGFPDGSHVLSLEHHGDVVPLLDGEPNPDSVEQVTVDFDAPGSGIRGNHTYTPYLAGAAAADSSTDPAIRDQLDDLRARGFLGDADGGGRSASSQVFQIRRVGG